MHVKRIVPWTSNRYQAVFLNQSRYKSAGNLCKRFVLLSALALGCGQVPVEDLPQTVPPETAQLVSTVTSGTVSSGDVIKVRFVKPAIDASLVGHILKKQVFTFTPPIDGIAQWETTQALVFRPNRPLPMRQSYQGPPRPCSSPTGARGPATPALRLRGCRARNPLTGRRFRPKNHQRPPLSNLPRPPQTDRKSRCAEGA